MKIHPEKHLAGASIDGSEDNKLLRKLLGKQYAEKIDPIKFQLEWSIRKGKPLQAAVFDLLACASEGSLWESTVRAAAYDLEEFR